MVFRLFTYIYSTYILFRNITHCLYDNALRYIFYIIAVCCRLSLLNNLVDSI